MLLNYFLYFPFFKVSFLFILVCARGLSHIVWWSLNVLILESNMKKLIGNFEGKTWGFCKRLIEPVFPLEEPLNVSMWMWVISLELLSFWKGVFEEHKLGWQHSGSWWDRSWGFTHCFPLTLLVIALSNSLPSVYSVLPTVSAHFKNMERTNLHSVGWLHPSQATWKGAGTWGFTAP